MNYPRTSLSLLLLSSLLPQPVRGAERAIHHAQGEMAGEVSTSSVILQSRLTASESAIDEDVQGIAGTARFELARNAEFGDSVATAWLQAVPEYDFIVKAKVTGLEPATRYWYRLVYGPKRTDVERGPARTFRTLAGAEGTDPVRFVVVTGMNYVKFHHGGKVAYRGPDKQLGYPALVAIRERKPDFFVGTGDNVYYDSRPFATTQEQLRRKWRQQFAQPRFIELFAEVPTYWEKDDHDYRYDDCDNSGDRAPSVALGLATFREQVPVVDPREEDSRTYRTYRMSKALQIWFVEGRDYRDPNAMPDGPDKTLWGMEQIAWLKRTLLASDAAFKLLISPTPLVGPDDLRKRDNHADVKGFRHEGNAFFAWLTENGFLEKGFSLICGDRHWQYRSIHPSGFEEFSSGALVDANSRLGRKPGDPKSTDPNAEVKQPYTQTKPSGGFLEVTVTPSSRRQWRASAKFTFRDEHGEVLYEHEKTATAGDREATK